jgi:phosphate:Na+ symporter
MTLLPFISDLLRVLSGSLAQQIAVSHFLFNIFIVAIFFFFLTPFSRMMEKIVPGREEPLPLWPEFLKESLLSDPEAALRGVQKELEREAVLAQKMFRETAPLKFAYDEGKRRNIRYIEMVVNHLREEIIEYLRSMSCRPLSAQYSKMLFAFTAIADDIERMANHMVSLVDLARTKAVRHIAFTDAAMNDLQEIEGLVGDNLNDTLRLLVDGEKEEGRTAAVTEREERIDQVVRQARDRHLVRFHERLCPAEAGPVFLEMLIHLERISDHCQNIVEYLDELNRP